MPRRKDKQKIRLGNPKAAGFIEEIIDCIEKEMTTIRYGQLL